MRLPRRRFLHLAMAAAALPSAPQIARAQAYPTRPVHMVVGFPAGNASDIIARLTAQSLSDRLGQQFVIENRPGASGSIGTEAVAKAPPDGYTLLAEVVTGNVINMVIYPNQKYNFIRDIAPVATVGVGAYVMVINPSIPARTVPEFIAYAKAHPGKINMASAGNAGPTHLFGALFMTMTGVKLVHVPYRGSFIPDLLGGQVQVVFGPISQLLEHVRAGKLRALAVTTKARQATLPDVPTIGEFVPGYDASVFYGVGAPRNTPADIIDKLNREVSSAIVDPKMKARLAALGATPFASSPAEFAKVIAEETEKWGKLVRAADIKPD
ncbi:MAG TPA: tripartite tricarboxylate transporter substrate binding protein [Xanthobacteraceae bacterium]|nr:tripartite tricarboxylate transporter substrate binding protein [Xanthobacteraceae bacterium]